MNALQARMAAVRTIKPAEAPTAAQTTMATGIQGAPTDDTLPPPPVAARAPLEVDQTPGYDPEKPVRFQACFTHRIMAGGWFLPEDGFYYPKTEKQLKALENLAKTGAVVPENY